MYVCFNNREMRLLKQLFSHHSWKDLIVTYSNNESFVNKDSEQAKKYGSLRSVFKMSASEIDNFRKKVGW